MTILSRFPIMLMFLAASVCDAAPILSAAKQSRDLALEATIADAASSWSDLEITCRLMNISSETISYFASTSALGFQIELLDKDGARVVMTPIFKNLITDFDHSSFKRSGPLELKPQGSVKFVFRPSKAFRAEDPGGYVLRVSWDSGFDRRGNRVVADKDLVAELKLPKSSRLKSSD